METTQKQIQKLKTVELNILEEFIKVCDILNVKYYLLEGTLLGAVRHKGFIPWDDDIDVGMPRRDYDIFMEKAQALLPERYFVQNIISEEDYRANFAKIRDSETTFIETSVRYCRINHGVYIDIFPLDFCYTDPKKQKRQFLKDKILKYRIGIEFYLPNAKKTYKYKICSVGLKVLLPSLRNTLQKRDNMIKSLPESNVYANYCSAWYKKEVMPVEWFGEGVYLEFEGVKVRVPKEYDKWLTQVYGDYMKLPPEEKRVAHHYADVIDTEKTYLEYIKN